MRTPIFPLLCAALGALAAEHPPDKSLEVSFRPQDLPKKVASCRALNRATNKLTDIDLGQHWPSVAMDTADHQKYRICGREPERGAHHSHGAWMAKPVA